MVLDLALCYLPFLSAMDLDVGITQMESGSISPGAASITSLTSCLDKGQALSGFPH